MYVVLVDFLHEFAFYTALYFCSLTIATPMFTSVYHVHFDGFPFQEIAIFFFLFTKREYKSRDVKLKKRIRPYQIILYKTKC